MFSIEGTVAACWAHDWNANTTITSESTKVSVHRLVYRVKEFVIAKCVTVGASWAVFASVLPPMRLVETRRAPSLIVTARRAQVTWTAGVFRRLGGVLTTGTIVSWITFTIWSGEMVFCAVRTWRTLLTVGYICTANIS